jgi:two-component system chemotaxis response regulator CheB
MNGVIKVLVVDDSPIFRKAVEQALSGESDIRIIGAVSNGAKALDFILRNETPDVITLDVEMPEMDGLATLAEIQRTHMASSDGKPIAVIMLSAFTRKGADVTLACLDAGAFDFIPKPSLSSPAESLDSLRRQLVLKIRCAATRRHGLATPTLRQRPPDLAETSTFRTPTIRPSMPRSSVQVIVIGISTGGPKALNEMLPSLCQKIELPILIVQHMPETFTRSLAEHLDKKCRHKVREAVDGWPVESNNVYVAPGAKHLVVRGTAANALIGINDQPPENGCKPAADVLFRSAANVYGGNVIALIMTGMGNDGTHGLRALKRQGASVIAQDEATSIVWGMPGSAVAANCVDRISPLDEIPNDVFRILEKGKI